jgi:hypothetical protein
MQVLIDRLAELQRTWPSGTWSWDDRFLAVAATFRSDVSEQARASAVAALPHCFDSKTIADAPTLLRAVCARTGGLRTGQLLFASEPVGNVTAYGLWWPWSGGTTITLRIGLDGASADLLRAPFGVK